MNNLRCSHDAMNKSWEKDVEQTKGSTRKTMKKKTSAIFFSLTFSNLQNRLSGKRNKRRDDVANYN
jgi:hypothetical protein